jgi:hypothetical protein
MHLRFKALGPRPLYLVEDMGDGPLRQTLEKSEPDSGVQAIQSIKRLMMFW